MKLVTSIKLLWLTIYNGFHPFFVVKLYYIWIVFYSKSGDDEVDGVDDDDENGNEALIKFDDVNVGSSIRVENNGHKVTRDADSFCNGVVFSQASSIMQSIERCSICIFPGISLVIWSKCDAKIDWF